MISFPTCCYPEPMERRQFLGLIGAGAAAGNMVSQAIAQRTEAAAVPAPLQFINKKPGTHPFLESPAPASEHLRHHARYGKSRPLPSQPRHAPRDEPAGHARSLQR